MIRTIALAISLGLATSAAAEVTIYTSEATYLAALDALGADIAAEGFEADSAWGEVRSTIPGGFHTAPSVTHLGVIWRPNTGTCGVTTGHGPARTGEWGFYEYPHGDPLNGINDGFVIAGERPLYGVGGWFETNTFGARIRFILDGIPTMEDEPLDYAHRFIGVIDPAGFATCEVQETETDDEVYYVFADDFLVGLTPSVGVPGGATAVVLAPLPPSVPNPFQGSTRIRFQLLEPAQVELRIIDVSGRVVRRLLEGETRSAGPHATAWNGRDEGGRRLAPGTYWYRVDAAGERAQGRLTLLR